MDVPETRYVKSGDTSIAYMTAGDGPPDILYVPNWTSNIEIFWESRPFGAIIRRLSAMGRVIFFDQPGNGLSDPIPPGAAPTMEQWMDDVRLVMDEVGSAQAFLFASDAAVPLALLFAASHPQRVAAQVLVNGYARLMRDVDYQWGFPEETRQSAIDFWMNLWGTGRQLAVTAPSVAGDAREVRAMGRAERHSASPGVARDIFRLISDLDVRHVLPVVKVPTLVLHSHNEWIRVQHGRYLAENIDGARLVELPGSDNNVSYSLLDPVMTEVARFFTGVQPMHERVDRVLATILFSDIVASTTHARELGDERWHELLDEHDQMVRLQIDRFRGFEVKTTGDGFLATFDGPARAIRCAQAICDSAARLGIHVRAGLHSGECELRGSDVGGIAVHVAARVMGEAGGDEVMVSSTVRDLVAGSGIVFEDRGVRFLEGTGEWRLFAAFR